MANPRNIIGTSGNDRLFAQGQGETVDGGQGVDTLVLTAGRANGSPGQWIIDMDQGLAYSPAVGGAFSVVPLSMRFQNIENVEATGFRDALYGTSGSNALYGLGGDDYIDGRAGNDLIVGGSGADTMVGGSGADTFKWLNIGESRPGAGADVILDFQSGDRLDLSAIDANTRVAGDQAFAFIGFQSFHRVAGELRLNGNGFEGDVNGDGVADIQVRINNGYVPHSWDFLL